MGGGGSFGFSKSKSKPVIESAAITPEQRAQLFPQVGNILGFNFSPTGGFTERDVTQQFGQIPMEGINRYQGMLQSAMSNPYQPTSAENQLLENIMGQTSSQFARRGLGASPVAASSVAGSIAPSLITMRQQQLANLFQGLSGELGVGQNLLTQRGQDIQSSLGQRQMKLEGLLQFLEQMGFRRNLGQESIARSYSTSGQGGIGGGGGGGGGGITT